MSPKRRESPERTARKRKTTRPDRLTELAEAIEDACFAPREIRMPQRLALGDDPGDDDPAYKAAAERYERDREAAWNRVVSAKRRLLAALRDALPDLEEQEACEIQAAADCMELQAVDPYEGYRESRFDLCAPRLKELAAPLRVRAEKTRATVRAATPETQTGETRKSAIHADNARGKSIRMKCPTLYPIMRDAWRDAERRGKNNIEVAERVAEHVRSRKAERWNDEEKKIIDAPCFWRLIYDQHRTHFKSRKT